MRIAQLFALGALSGLLLGCGDDGGGAGRLRVLLSAEETISEGLQVGADDENTRDYAVTYSKFLVAIGRVSVGRASLSETRLSEAVSIADMRQVGEEGLELASFEDLSAGQWNQFGFETPNASAGAQKLPGVTDADAQEMIDKQLTYWIEGRVEKPGAPVDFVLKVALAARYENCESNGQPGVSVSEDATSTATITLHGDHLWFNTLARGDEAHGHPLRAVDGRRRRRWRRQGRDRRPGPVPAEKVFPSSKGYNLSGAPIPIATALDFVRAALSTQGHLNGEGECTTSLL